MDKLHDESDSNVLMVILENIKEYDARTINGYRNVDILFFHALKIRVENYLEEAQRLEEELQQLKGFTRAEQIEDLINILNNIFKREENLKYLLEEKDAINQTLIFYALAYEAEKIIDFLIDKVNLEKRDINNATCLLYCISQKNIHLII